MKKESEAVALLGQTVKTMRGGQPGQQMCADVRQDPWPNPEGAGNAGEAVAEPLVDEQEEP